MAASNLPIVQSTVPSHLVRNEKTGTAGGGQDIIAQVVLAGIQKRTYLGTQVLNLSGTSQSLTVPAGVPAALADIYCEGAGTSDYARYWHGGSVPTASAGKKLKDHEELQSADPGTFQSIIGTGSPKLVVEYYSNG